MTTMTNGRSATYRDPRLQRVCTECGAGIDLCSCESPDDAAHRRLWSREGRALGEVWRALQRTIDEGFAKEFQHDWLAGELTVRMSEALRRLRGHSHSDGTTTDDVHRACIVVAVGALLLSLYGDPAYAYEPAAYHDREDA